MTVLLDNLDQTAWDEYVGRHCNSCFAHCFAYGEALAATYRLPLARLAVVDEGGFGEVHGILPLLLFHAPNSDRRLISLPYTDSAGMLVDDPGYGNQLLEAALDLTVKLDAAHLELRQAGQSCFATSEAESVVGVKHAPHTFKTGLRRPLPESVDRLWSLLKPKNRNQARKARKCGCRVETGGSELLEPFYTVFSENMRDLGSPVHDLLLFQNLFSKSSLDVSIVAIFLDRQPVAAAIVFRHNGTLYNPWASSLRAFRPLCPNMLLYWSLLELAVQKGCRFFDFGRSSPNAPTCRFKCHWGAVPTPLTWHVFSRKGACWHPQQESLSLDSWKELELIDFRRRGPAVRRWISL